MRKSNRARYISVFSMMFSGGLSAALLAVTADAYAVPNGTVELTGTDMRNYIGATVDAKYLKNDMSYGDMTLAYFGVETLSGSDTISYTTPDNLVGRSVIWYKGVVPSDKVTSDRFYGAPLVAPVWNLAFDDVTYFDGGFMTYQGYSNPSTDMSVTTLRNYCYLDYRYENNNERFPIDARRTDSTKAGIFRITQNSSGIYYGAQNIWQGSASQFIIGTQCSYFLMEDSGGVTLGLICPIINDDFSFGGHVQPPSDVGGGTGGASGGGYISTDVSGSTVFTYSATVEYPGYFQTADVTDYDAGTYGTQVTAMVSDADVAASAAVSAVSGLSQYDSGILWYSINAIFAKCPELIAVILGTCGIALFGWVLNRYAG